MATIVESVVIRRPVEDVFRFYTDFRNLPRFLGDVMAVEQIGASTWRWTIQGPLGLEVTWTIEVTETLPDQLIRYETVGLAALRTRWDVYFTRRPNPDETEVCEVMMPPLAGVGRATLELLGKPPAAEMAANLRRLKELMETGRVTYVRHAVAGKFDHQP